MSSGLQTGLADIDAAALAAKTIAENTGLAADIPAALASLASRISALETQFPNITTAVAEVHAAYTEIKAALPEDVTGVFARFEQLVKSHFPNL